LAKKKDGRKTRRAAARGGAGKEPSPREALRLSEARQRALIELIPDIMYRMRADGTFIEMIPGKHTKPVIPSEELLGRRLHDVFPREVADMGAQAIEGALSSGEVQAFEHELEVDGELRYFDVRIAAIDADECLAIVREVTERRRAVEGLRTSEERYRVMYEDNPSMYFTVDAGGEVLSVNRFGADQLGYAADELVGRSVLDVFIEPDRAAVREQLAQCLKNPAQVVNWEFRKLRKDGSLMWVKEAARAVPGPGGDTIVLIVCEDITERRQTEEALQEAREELESSVEVQMAKGNAYGLTFRELTVLNLVAGGRSDKEIATLLGISLRTANKHVENILAKMGASSRTEAGVRAVREGLLQAGSGGT
jgi:PAS domain S-box-containing protein